MKNDFPYLYPYSLSIAREQDELPLWKESFEHNLSCKEYIEKAIRKDFDGYQLKHDCAKSVIEKFGFLRTAFVLASTVQHKLYDGRFSPSTKDWAKDIFIPNNMRTSEYVIESHPAVLNGFIDEFRAEFDKLQLLSPKSCTSMAGNPLAGKVLVLKPSALKEQYWSPANQLWFAEGGFGCIPSASGRAIYATCLGDGEEHIRWNREDFIGVLRDELLPAWAKVQLAKLNVGQKIAPIESNNIQVLK